MRPRVALRLLVHLGAAVLIVGVGPCWVAATVDAANTTADIASWPQVTCRVGEQLLLPNGAAVESDGWIQIDYGTGSDATIQEIPPAGFVLGNASNDELARHHLALRPAAGSALSNWSRDFGSMQWLRTRGLCLDTSGPANSTLYIASPHWSGSATMAVQAYSFTGVQGYYYQPTITPIQCGSPPRTQNHSIWVGLGGANGGTLIQAGSQEVTGPSGPVTYQFFAEMVSPGDYHPTSGTTVVRPTDAVFSYVTTSGGSWVWEVYNLTTGYVWGTFSHALVAGATNVTGSAEWIDERPDEYNALARYGSSYWSGMRVFRSNSSAWTGAYGEPTQWVFSVQESGTVLSRSSGTASNNTMTDTWVRGAAIC